MKALAAFVLVATAVASGSSAARRPPTPLPVSVAFFDARHGVLGSEGTIETTADGGRTWTIRLRGAGPYRLLEERGGNEIWATGRRHSLHSTDRGLSWQRTRRPPISGAAFGSPLIGWIVKPVWPPSDGPPPWLWKTRDGGRTWRRVTRVCRWRGIDFHFSGGLAHVSPSRAWIVCVGQAGVGMQHKAVLETRDGGRSWAMRACGCSRPDARGRLGWAGYPHAIEFTPRGDGALFQHRGAPISITQDGGRTWTRFVGQPELDLRLDAAIISARRIYAVTGEAGERAKLQLTTDGGRTWHVIRSWGD